MADDPAAKASFFGRHEFLVRRLHSLSGLVPIGAYLCVHLLTNASVVNGAESFQRQVDRIHGLGVLLPVVEWVFIFLPLIFHAVIGVVMIHGGMPNTGNYPMIGNVRYTLQRATGMIAFAFIAWHVIQMHHFFGAPFKNVEVFPLPTGSARFDPHAATSSAAETIQAGLGIQILYAVGTLSCVYHLANGLWTMGITWGVWTTAAAQRRANYVCGAFGVGLAVVALTALFGMSSVDVAEARAFEKAHQEAVAAERDRTEPHRRQADGQRAASPARAQDRSERQPR